MENCPDNLIYYTIDVYLLQPRYGELAFTKFSTNFFTAFIYFHLCALIFIYKNLFLFMIVCENLFLSHSWSTVRIFSFLQESFLIHDDLWKSLLFCENLCLFMIICENLLVHLFTFYSLYENKQAYESWILPSKTNLL